MKNLQVIKLSIMLLLVSTLTGCFWGRPPGIYPGSVHIDGGGNGGHDNSHGNKHGDKH